MRNSQLKCTCGSCRTCKTREAWRQKKDYYRRHQQDPELYDHLPGMYAFHWLPTKAAGLNGIYTGRELGALLVSNCVPVGAVVERQDETLYRIIYSPRRQRLVLVQVAV